MYIHQFCLDYIGAIRIKLPNHYTSFKLTLLIKEYLCITIFILYLSVMW